MTRRQTGAARARAEVERAPARLLVLDGEACVRDTLAAALRTQGYEVAAAGTVREARAVLTTGTVDLVLTDLRLSEPDGADPLGVVRTLAPEAVVIVLTGYATLESALRALHGGAYAYLVKPTDVDELRLMVARGLERRRLERELARRVRELEAANHAIQGFNEQLRDEIATATDALRRKVAELDASNQRLKQAQEEHQRFVAMVAHELRGPLGLVMNYAQLAARQDVSREAVQRYAGSIVEHALRLNRLVEDLQTATRLSTGHFRLRLGPCDLVAATRAVVEEMRATTPERVFTFEGDPEVGMVNVDEDRVTQAVRNLLDNAVKYSSEGGAIETEVRADATTISIRVRDHGAGILDADIERILKPFERGPGSAQVPGSGLGLFITRGIVLAHGGELRVQHGPGSDRARGALFTIVLPRVTPTASPAPDATPV